MPELPEVETMRRTIAGCVGTQVAAVERCPCPRKPILVSPRIDHLRRRLVGRTIVGTGRAGKRVVVQFDSDDKLVLEPRMTGLVLVADPPSAEHLRLRIGLDSGGRVVRDGTAASQLLYWDRRGLGSVRLFRPDEFAAAFGPEKLGPDGLDVTGPLLREKLGKSRRAIKVALLDQRAVAGIGNIYASEILHVVHIDPRKRCDRISKTDWQRIADATLEVLHEAIRCEGSTLGDGTYRNALNQEGTYQNLHRVYGRAGEVCPSCSDGEIRQVVQAQRSTFFCPACQRR